MNAKAVRGCTAALAIALGSLAGCQSSHGTALGGAATPVGRAGTPAANRTAKPRASHGSIVKTAHPWITAVRVSGKEGDYTLTVHGRGFGAPAVPIPSQADAPNFRVADNAQLGFGEWGYQGNASKLRYLAWTNTRIRVTGLGADPGDALAVALWNRRTGRGATWGGNVPGGSPRTPVITSVTFSGTGADLRIVVRGSSFGPSPAEMPFEGDLNWFFFTDFRTHCKVGSALFGAGGGGWGVAPPATVTLEFQSWSDHKIVISGFGGVYGSRCARERDHDPVIVSVWNSAARTVRGPQSAWGGRT
jgi:hypothetical protein